MKKLFFLVFILVGLVGNYFYNQQNSQSLGNNLFADSDFTFSKEYKCDGRKYCSQMTSCEEAKFFINNCPGTKMDGDGDGIPCERQWCGGK